MNVIMYNAKYAAILGNPNVGTGLKNETACERVTKVYDFVLSANEEIPD